MLQIVILVVTAEEVPGSKQTALLSNSSMCNILIFMYDKQSRQISVVKCVCLYSLAFVPLKHMRRMIFGLGMCSAKHWKICVSLFHITGLDPANNFWQSPPPTADKTTPNAVPGVSCPPPPPDQQFGEHFRLQQDGRWENPLLVREISSIRANYCWIQPNMSKHHALCWQLSV